MDPIELHLRNDTNVKVCPVYKSSPVKHGDECFHYQIQKNCVVKNVVSYTRKTVPDHRTIRELPWPKFMVSSTECKQGSIMLVLDSAAEVTLVRQPLRLGYQFWFGDYPYMVTPNGEEVPLYHKSNGYLGL